MGIAMGHQVLLNEIRDHYQNDDGFPVRLTNLMCVLYIFFLHDLKGSCQNFWREPDVTGTNLKTHM